MRNVPATRLTRRDIVLGAAALLGSLAVADDPAMAAGVTRKVILFRGFMNVFSYGLDDLARTLRARGIDAEVYGHLSSQSAIVAVTEAARKQPGGKVVIVGHSLGGNAAMSTSRTLAEQNVKIPLVVTLDPTASGPVSGKVGRYVNYYMSGNVLGTAIGGKVSKGRVRNIDIRDRPDLVATDVGHWNMTENPTIKHEIVDLIVRALGK